MPRAGTLEAQVLAVTPRDCWRMPHEIGGEASTPAMSDTKARAALDRLHRKGLVHRGLMRVGGYDASHYMTVSKEHGIDWLSEHEHEQVAAAHGVTSVDRR